MVFLENETISQAVKGVGKKGHLKGILLFAHEIIKSYKFTAKIYQK